jgi:hypothetical protein
MRDRLRAALGRCGCGGRAWSTPRRPAARRMLRSGILQSRMNAVRGKARRTLLQNDAAGAEVGGRTPRSGGAAEGRRDVTSAHRDSSPPPRRDSSRGSDFECHSEGGASLYRPSHQTLAPTEESRATASAARPVARRARTLRVRWERLARATPDRGPADVSVRDSSVAQGSGTGKARRTLLQNDAPAPRWTAGYRRGGRCLRGGRRGANGHELPRSLMREAVLGSSALHQFIPESHARWIAANPACGPGARRRCAGS